MTVTHTPPETAEFTHWLAGLTARLRPDAGWYGVFAARDPEGLRACLDGTELLPWDVVSSLLQDAGETADGPFAVRGRALYAAAAGAHDRRPGAAAALAERRELMERERRYAESRARELEERLRTVPGPGPGEAARLERDLAWTRDDLARATARVAELTARLGARPAGERGVAPVAAAGALEVVPSAAPVKPERAVKAERRPRGARYAWLEESDEAREAEAVPAPVLPAGGAAPRGARFGGGAGPGEPGGGAVGGRPGPWGRTPPRPPARRRTPSTPCAGSAPGAVAARPTPCSARRWAARPPGCPRSPTSCTGPDSAPTGPPSSGRRPRCRPTGSQPSPGSSPTRAGRPTASGSSARAWPARSRNWPEPAPPCVPRSTTARPTPS
ncbi:hypothetical protein [Streptomyces sp. WAC04657]|uniref:hypothetical protein n=1 Tax=Streptomyces sp. WAC04657 TaxID=1779145 RepID=UPI000A946577|nr:hypothetical protein [Streptomyces sp. WAC04657]